MIDTIKQYRTQYLISDMQSSTSHAPPSGDNNEESPQITDYDKQMNDASSLLDLAKSSMPATASNIVVNNSSNNNNITFADTTTVGSNNIASSSTNAKAKASRQKNDKPVEVCHGLDKKVIARFKTQTECACYLRATPEAVSYHCSRGGGVCNGLFVRPVVAVTSTTSTTSSSATVGEGSAAGDNNMYFGLFDGSSTHRPPARPQISTEVVSILKAWLLSPGHIDNPYPTGLEFDALMETTKLDKMQLKHWFNNARKRIWKPLVKSEGRLMPKFGKIGKRSRSAVSGEDANNIIDGVPDAAPASSSHAAAATDITKRGGRKRTSTSNKRRKTNDSTTMMAEGGGGGGTSAIVNNMCHSIGGQDYFHRRESDDSRVSTGSSNSNNNNLNMLMMDRYSRLLGNMGMFSQGNNGGGGPPPMMGGHSMMNSSGATMNRSMMMMDPSAGATTFHHNSGLNSNKSYFGMRASSNSNNSGGGGGGSFMSRDGGGLLSSSFQGCMEVNDGGSSHHHGGMRNETGQELPYNATTTSTTGNTMNYCQPLIQPNNTTSTNTTQGQGFPIKKRKNSVHSASLIESVRSNAVFKQQVASMAMNEASTSFKEMEDAFARSKDIAARVRDENNNIPEADDVRVMEANAHAKACQNTAMFKLKVSQRASEEAASAYDCYLRLVEDNDSLV